MGWAKLAAAVASGAALSLAFFPCDAGWVVWIALLPLIAVLSSLQGKRRGWKGFGLGWLAGFAFFALNVNWLSEVTSIGPFALAAYLALYFAAYGAFAAGWGNVAADAAPRLGRVLQLAFCHAAVWGGLEWLRGWLLTGFGWNGLGVALHNSRVLVQAADVFGVTGLSMGIVAVNVLVWIAVRRWLLARRIGPELGAVAALFLGVSVYGVWRIASLSQAPTTPLRALLVQLNIPQEAAHQLWSAEEIHIAYEEETGKALDAIRAANAAAKSDAEKWQPDWLVWPETALTGHLATTTDGKWGMWRDDTETLGQVREGQAFTMIFGQNEYEAEIIDGELQQKERGRIYNSMVTLSANDELKTFRKHHLVIFGETIPFIEELPWLKKIYEQQSGVEYSGSFSEGESLEPLSLDVRGRKIGVIPSVCFEDTVPRLMRKFVRDEPQVLVNITNDGWFKQSPAALQHFANAKFRAIELRRPLVRCANTGVSAAVDVLGGIVNPQTGRPQILMDANGSVFTRGWLPVDVAVPLAPATSLYALCGDWPVIGLALAGLVFGWWGKRRELSAGTC